jgi:hypothetical protein
VKRETIHILFVAISPHLLYATIRANKRLSFASRRGRALGEKRENRFFALQCPEKGFVVKMCELPLVKEGMVYPALERAKRTTMAVSVVRPWSSRERG